MPTLDIRETGEKHTFDGVEIEFQMAPGTEAPAEMHFYFPKFRALCMAENATHNLHNLLTLARRPGSGSARLGGLSDRGDRHVRRPRRCGVRIASLADLG